MRSIYLFTIILLFVVTLGACSKNDTFSIKSEPIPGDNENYAVIIGQGFDSVKLEPKGFCVEHGALQTQSGQSNAKTQTFEMSEINSITELRKVLEVSASASFKGWGGSYKGSMHLLNSYNHSGYSKYFYIHVVIQNPLEIVSSFKFKDSALNLLKRYGMDKNFVNQCGNTFVYGRRTGAEFLAIVEINIENENDINKWEAAIKASGWGFKTSAEVSSALEKFNAFANTKVYMLSKGAIKGFPDYNNTQTLTEFARNFNGYITEAEKQASAGSLTVNLLIKDYSGVEPLDIGLEREVYQTQQQILETLLQQKDMVLQDLNSIAVIKRNPDKFQEFKADELDQLEENLRKYFNLLNNAGKQCIVNPWKQCKLVSTPYPKVDLPKFKYNNSIDLDAVCHKERKMLLEKKIISVEDYEFYTSQNLAPYYKTDADRKKFIIEGWYVCRTVAEYIYRLQNTTN